MVVLSEPGSAGLPRSGEDLLGQRRAVIRQRLLVTDEGHRPGVTLPAQSLDDTQVCS